MNRPRRSVHGHFLLALVLAAALLTASPTGSLAAGTDPDHAPAPGSLGRLLSAGDAETSEGEYINGLFTTDPDGSDPAPLIQWLRPFTQADQDAGRQNASIQNPEVSPDGSRIVAWVRDPHGFVIPGGTPEPNYDDPWGGPTGEVLALFDSTGRFIRSVLEPKTERDHTPYESYWRLSWLDQQQVIVAGSQVLHAGTPEQTTRGVLKRVNVTTGSVVTIPFEDATYVGNFLTQGWGGGGTLVAKSATRATYVQRVGESGWVELPEAVPGDETNDGFQHAAVSPDGRHIAVSYQGPRTEQGTRPQIDVFDLAETGVWERRNVAVPGLSQDAHWPAWLPYTNYVDAELLLPIERPDGVDSAAAVRVAPSITAEDRVTRTFPGTTGSHLWQALPVPPADSGLADVGLTIPSTSTEVGRQWTALMRVTGRGPAPAQQVRLAVHLDGVSSPSLSLPTGAAGSCASGVCTLPSLAPGQSVEIQVSARFDASGVVPLRATVTSESGDWNPGNNRRTVGVRVNSPARPMVTGRVIKQAANGGDIIASNPDGTQAEVLVSEPAGKSIYLQEVHPETGVFLWSEDGNRFHVVTVAGAPVRSFVVPAGALILSVAITPDGRTAFWTRNVPQGNSQANDDLFLIESRRIDVAGSPTREQHRSIGAVPQGLRVSPDGTRLAYVNQPIGDYARSAVVTDLDFRRKTVLNVGSHGDLRVNTTPAWSPDGTKIALATGDGSPYDPNGKVLAFSMATPDEPEVLAAQTEAFGMGQWSPDGRQIIMGDLERTVSLSLITKRFRTLSPGRARWSGDPLASPPKDTTAPAARYQRLPGPYVRPGTTVTFKKLSASDDIDSPAALQVRVTWGDGTTSNGTGATASFTHTYSATARRALRVYVTDRAGNTTTAHTSTLVVDGIAPSVTVDLPPCGSRRGKVCTSYRGTRAAWSTVRGRSADTGGSSLSTVTAALVQQRGKRWYSYNGATWTARPSKATALAVAKKNAVTRRSTTWSVPASGLTAGVLVVTALAQDRAGNVKSTVRTHTLR